ncbi:MAG: hypothetical protein R3C60_02875 [Parvularculaceae bacterium]
MPELDIYSPLELDDELCRQLGILTARWSMLEEALYRLLGHLIGDEDTARKMYFSLGAFRQRIELIKAAADEQILIEGDFFTCSDLLTKIYDLFKKRSTLIHRAYCVVVRLDNGQSELWNVLFHIDQIKLENAKKRYIGIIGEGDPKRINKATFSSHNKRVIELIDKIIEINSALNCAGIPLRRDEQKDAP